MIPDLRINLVRGTGIVTTLPNQASYNAGSRAHHL